MKLILSSSNKDKIKEIQSILGDEFDVVLKSEVGLADLEVEEDGETLQENSSKKARAIFEKTKKATIADDTGLFVDALDGRPGIYAARYSGENATYDSNNEKMLNELKDITNIEDRSAKFITNICLITENGDEYHVEGVLDGYINFEKKGENKFGYNPIFLVKGLNKTLAELSDKERSSINHRRKALDKLKSLLNSLTEE